LIVHISLFQHLVNYCLETRTMAGDWIKMRMDLTDDPAVVSIAADLDCDIDLVVGKLHRLWSWADKHTTDGFVPKISEKWLGRFIGKDFAQAMVDAGWLIFEEGGLRFPKFENHNGVSAKKRAEASLRKSKQRIKEMEEAERAVQLRDLNVTNVTRLRDKSVTDVTDLSQKSVTDVTKKCDTSVTDVTQPCDKSVTREEKRREEELRESACVPTCSTVVPPWEPYEGNVNSSNEKFKRLCDAYPNGVDLDQALQVWRGMLEFHDQIELMIETINAWKIGEEWQREGGRYVPLLRKWLRGKRWNDPHPPPAKPGKSRDSPGKSFEDIEYESLRKEAEQRQTKRTKEP
jgi:hypothetical protein